MPEQPCRKHRLGNSPLGALVISYTAIRVSDQPGVDGLGVHRFKRIGDNQINIFLGEFPQRRGLELVLRLQSKADKQLVLSCLLGTPRKEIRCGFESNAQVLPGSSAFSRAINLTSLWAIIRNSRGHYQAVAPRKVLS